MFWSQVTAATEPERPGKAVTLPVFGLKRAAPGESTPPRLVKLPPTNIPAKDPSFWVKGHIAMICASVDETLVRMPIGSGVSRAWVPSGIDSVCSLY